MGRPTQTPDRYVHIGLTDNPVALSLLPMEINALLHALHVKADNDDGFDFWEIRAYTKMMEVCAEIDRPIPSLRVRNNHGGSVRL